MTGTKRASALIVVLAISLGSFAAAAADSFYLEVSPKSPGDLARLMDALEASFDEALVRREPVVIVLHGEEAGIFTRQSYAENRTLVDRAALLDAYNLIDMRMCETWMSNNNIQKSDLLPFIDTVPYAPEEIRKLRTEGYLQHPSVEI